MQPLPLSQTIVAKTIEAKQSKLDQLNGSLQGITYAA